LFVFLTNGSQVVVANEPDSEPAPKAAPAALAQPLLHAGDARITVVSCAYTAPSSSASTQSPHT